MISADRPLRGFPAGPPPGCPPNGEATPLFGEEFEAHPKAVYGRLRERWGPVAPVLLGPGVPAWLVLGYAELLQVTRDEMVFSKDPRRWRDLREGRIPPDFDLLPMMAYRPWVLFTDGRAHERLRGAINDSLAKVGMTRLRRDIRRMANILIDGFVEAGRVDILASYANQLPLRVINRLFGLPDENGDALVELLNRIWDRDSALEATAEYEQLMRGLVACKRGEPDEDFTSWLMAHPATLTDEEMLHQLVLTVSAGNDPTAGLIANSLRVLLTDEHLRFQLASAQMLIAEAIDQVLWRDPPLQNFPAWYPTHDVRLGSVQLRAGDAVVVSLAAANADPLLTGGSSGPDGAAAYPPSSNRAHLAWGAGRHRCPAQDIARLIVEVGLETLLHRLPDMRLAVPEEDLRWRPSLFVRALVSLPVTFTPRAVTPRPAPMETMIWPTPAGRRTGQPAGTAGRSAGRERPGRRRWFRRDQRD